MQANGCRPGESSIPSSSTTRSSLTRIESPSKGRHSIPLMKHWNSKKKKYPRVPILTRHWKGKAEKKSCCAYVLNIGDSCKSSGSDAGVSKSTKWESRTTYNFQSHQSRQRSGLIQPNDGRPRVQHTRSIENLVWSRTEMGPLFLTVIICKLKKINGTETGQTKGLRSPHMFNIGL